MPMFAARRRSRARWWAWASSPRLSAPLWWPHWLLAYFEMFARDFERLRQARARVNVMPLGSGALAGSGFPFDREAIARDLGFAGITRNSMDVSGDRDFALDF